MITGMMHLTGKELAELTGNKRMNRKALKKIGLITQERYWNCTDYFYSVTGRVVVLTQDSIFNFFENESETLTKEDIEKIKNGELELIIELCHAKKIASYFFAEGSTVYDLNEGDYDKVCDFLLNCN